MNAESLKKEVKKFKCDSKVAEKIHSLYFTPEDYIRAIKLENFTLIVKRTIVPAPHRSIFAQKTETHLAFYQYKLCIHHSFDELLKVVSKIKQYQDDLQTRSEMEVI